MGDVQLTWELAGCYRVGNTQLRMRIRNTQVGVIAYHGVMSSRRDSSEKRQFMN